MKWTLNELSHNVEPLHFKSVLDLSKYIVSSDIVEIDPVVVKGSTRYENGLYYFNYKIDTVIYLECAYTCKKVPIKISKWFEDVFSQTGFDGNIYLDKNYIVLEDMVYANILNEKPLRVISPDAKAFHDDEEETETENPAFAGLKKYLEGDK